MKKGILLILSIFFMSNAYAQQTKPATPSDDTQKSEMQSQLKEMQKALDTIDFSQFFDVQSFDLNSLLDTSQMNQMFGKDFQMMFGDDINTLFETEGFDEIMQQSFKILEEMDPQEMQKLMEGIDFKQIEKMMQDMDLDEMMKMFEMPEQQKPKDSNPK